MAPETVLHFSDIHFEDPDVYEDNWGVLDEYSDQVFDRLERLLNGRVEDVSGIDYALFNGDCGTSGDWEEMQRYLGDSDLRDWVMVPGNSDQQDYVDYQDVEDLSEVEQNTRRFSLNASGVEYEMLLSHMPQNIGVDRGNSDSRRSYLQESNSRGVPLASEGDHDINFTAHYHGEDSFVMDDGKLTVQGGAVGDNYITSGKLPDSSVQVIEFEGEEVTIKHVDFMNLEVVEQRTYRNADDGFEQVSVDSPWTNKDRFD